MAIRMHLPIKWKPLLSRPVLISLNPISASACTVVKDECSSSNSNRLASAKKASPAVLDSSGSVLNPGRFERPQATDNTALTSSGLQYFIRPLDMSCRKHSCENSTKAGCCQQKYKLIKWPTNDASQVTRVQDSDGMRFLIGCPSSLDISPRLDVCPKCLISPDELNKDLPIMSERSPSNDCEAERLGNNTFCLRESAMASRFSSARICSTISATSESDEDRIEATMMPNAPFRSLRVSISRFSAPFLLWSLSMS